MWKNKEKVRQMSEPPQNVRLNIFGEKKGKKGKKPRREKTFTSQSHADTKGGPIRNKGSLPFLKSPIFPQ